MMSSTPALIHRVGGLIREHQHWFEAVESWCKTAKWSKKIFTNYLMSRNRPAGRALLSVNDRTLEDPFRDRQAPAAAPTWWIPASALRAGENQIRVWVDPKNAGLSIDGINVEHVPELTIDTKRDHRPQPRPTAQMAIAVALGAGYRPQADRLTVRVDHDHVIITLDFERDVPGRCLVGVTVKLPTIGYSQILEDLWDFVADSVKKKIKQLVKEYYRKLQVGDPSATEIETQLRDLRSYLELHETHLAQALAADDEMTMVEIIAQSSRPVPVLVEEGPTVTPVEDIPVVKPVRDVPREVRPAPHSPKSGMGCAAQLFMAVLLIGVTVSALLGVAWYAGLINVNQFAKIGGNARERELDDLLKAKGAQTGDVQISLIWFNKNDLDLQVVAPSGEIVSFLNRESKCGGKLDIDMNVVYANASDRAVENIFWQQGKAPKGRYKVFVNHFQSHNQPDTRDPTRFSVRVLIRGEPHWYHGEVVHADPKKQRVLVNEFEVK